jgi:predicted deacylase
VNALGGIGGAAGAPLDGAEEISAEAGAAPAEGKPASTDAAPAGLTSVAQARGEASLLAADMLRASVHGIQHGAAGADAVYASLPDYMTKPSSVVGTSRAGYSWSAEDFDAVMKAFGIGDAEGLVQTAISMDRGNRYLERDELEQAAKELSAYMTEGLDWSEGDLASVMAERGIDERTLLLKTAKRHDDGDKVIDRAELERAADVLENVVGAHDFDGIMARVDALEGRSDLSVEQLGTTAEGQQIKAVHFPCTGGEPAMRVLVTGGVHGNEPCGAAAATLLMEQLAANPKLREHVEVTVVPVVNPRSLLDGTRRTPEDVDLNRVMVGADDDDHAELPEEARIVQDLVANRSFDLALDLHSGKAARNGFWVLHKASAEIMGPAIARFREDWPALNGDAKPYTMTAPGVGVSGSTATLKDLAFNAGARWAVTVEAPGSVSYRDQVIGENEIVHHAMQQALIQLEAERPGSA